MPWWATSPLALQACTSKAPQERYEAAAQNTWQAGAMSDLRGPALARDLVRLATLAPSSHNTQCWKFGLKKAGQSIVVYPDLARRCPAADPDDHHLFVSLGCATENLAQAALAHGLHAQALFNAPGDAVQVDLTPTAAQQTPSFLALPQRQSTRTDYDGKPLSVNELELLKRAGRSEQVSLLLITDRPAMGRVRDFVVQGNYAQMADKAFVKELKSWIRFNAAEALEQRDGLYSALSGQPNLPSWLGRTAFRCLLDPAGQAKSYARQINTSAGIAIFTGRSADKANWFEVGRCYQRFALQATALGIRNAFLNQVVEVVDTREAFAASLGMSGQRPDLVVRFGRGPLMPRSLRRPVEAVLV
jgi:hypothetical protein